MMPCRVPRAHLSDWHQGTYGSKGTHTRMHMHIAARAQHTPTHTHEYTPATSKTYDHNTH